MTGSIPVAPTSFRVMIVEDDADDAYLLTRALRRAADERRLDLEAARFRDGWEAIRAVGHSDILDALPDLVIVDLNMPVMDGLRFIRLIRGELRLPALPAVVLTTSDRGEIHDEARAAGAGEVFVKPNRHHDYVTIAHAMIATVLGEGPPPLPDGAVAARPCAL